MRNRARAALGGLALAGLPLWAAAASMASEAALPRGSARSPVAALDQEEEALAEAIARSTSSLRQEDHPAPYFVGLRLTDAEGGSESCSLGSLRGSNRYRTRRVAVDLRVGSYALDNHPLGPSGAANGRELPYEPGYPLRHALWAELDKAYKAAVSGWLLKQASRVRRGKAEYETDDLSREPPLLRPRPALPAEGEGFWAGVERDCRRASAAFRARPSLQWSDVSYRLSRGYERMLNSEGTRAAEPGWLGQVILSAWELSPDGMPVAVEREFLVPSPGALPSAGRLEAEAAAMLADVSALAAASSTSPFTAPAVLDPSVSAALIAALATRMSGEEQRNPSGAQTFRQKVGERIMPEFLGLVDDPALAEFEGEALVGGYAVDDEGVPGSRVRVVARGRLQAFLLSRHPVVGLPRSNGHGRAGPGHQAMGRASNLVLEAERPLDPKGLLSELRRLCREQGKSHGLWIERTRAWSQQGGVGNQQAFRLHPTRVYLVDAATGERRLVRDLDLVGTPLDLVGKIRAAGSDRRATHTLVSQESGRIPVSVVAPSLLLAEVELQRSSAKPQNGPVLPPPIP